MTQYSGTPIEQTRTRAKTIISTNVQLANGETKKAIIISDDYKDTNFIKLFRGGIKIMKPTTVAVFWGMMMVASRTNVVTLVAAELAEITGVGVTTVKSALRQLIKVGYIKRIHRGVYLLNPSVVLQISPRYRVAIDNAWKSGSLKNIEGDMREVDKKTHEKTKCNMVATRPQAKIVSGINQALRGGGVLVELPNSQVPLTDPDFVFEDNSGIVAS